MSAIPTTIRKELLQLLEKKVIPAVRTAQAIHLILADLPIQLPAAIQVTHLSLPLLEDDETATPKFGQQWPEARVHNFHGTYIAFLLEGEADLRVGVTQSMARAAQGEDEWLGSGCHILHLQAPTMLLYPPGVPFSDGTCLLWERGGPLPPQTRIFWIHILPDCVLCHSSEHPLLIRDDKLPAIIDWFKEELAERAPDYEAVARSHLVSFFLRLRRRLMLDEPVLGNTAWLPEPEFASSPLPAGLVSDTRQIVGLADEFIQTHLSEQLTLGQIAAHCGVSPTHLNRIFNANLGISVKRYVNRQRIRAACLILDVSDVSIKEVARLVGFSLVPHFCQVFMQIQKVSPGQYRKQQRKQAEIGKTMSGNVKNAP